MIFLLRSKNPLTNKKRETKLRTNLRIIFKTINIIVLIIFCPGNIGKVGTHMSSVYRIIEIKTDSYSLVMLNELLHVSSHSSFFRIRLLSSSLFQDLVRHGVRKMF